MGTIIVGGALVIVVALIVFNMVRKVRQGKSVFCTSSCNCGCGCGAGVSCQSHQEPGKEDASSSSTCCCCEGTQSHHHEPEKQ